MKIAYHIAIEGTIGVGKTSLAKLLADRLDGRLIYPGDAPGGKSRGAAAGGRGGSRC